MLPMTIRCTLQTTKTTRTFQSGTFFCPEENGLQCLCLCSELHWTLMQITFHFRECHHSILLVLISTPCEWAVTQPSVITFLLRLSVSPSLNKLSCVNRPLWSCELLNHLGLGGAASLPWWCTNVSKFQPRNHRYLLSQASAYLLIHATSLLARGRTICTRSVPASCSVSLGSSHRRRLGLMSSSSRDPMSSSLFGERVGCVFVW